MYNTTIADFKTFFSLPIKINKADSWSIFIIIGIVVLLFLLHLFFYIKNKIWDEPKYKIIEKEIEIRKLKDQITDLQNKITNLLNLSDKINLFDTHEKDTISIITNSLSIYKKDDIFKILYLYDLINNLNSNDNFSDILKILIDDTNYNKNKKIILLESRIQFLESAQSNLTAIPYMAQIMADYETYEIEKLAKELEWGFSIKRMEKVLSIREIRKVAKEMVEKNKEAQYQLSYLLELFPTLQDIIETDFNQLPIIKVEDISNYDRTRDFLSKEEYQSLSVTERNQLALDRYKSSHKKTKWQIGRDYEYYIGYKYYLKGYDVDFFGSYMGLEDLGRDIIAKKDNKTLIIQCKYWSSKKLIHEKHITQLYGTMMSYCIEHNCNKSSVNGVLITNITLSDTAKKMAHFLNIKYKENVPAGNYPCIKCNVGHNKDGITKIYHLPFDQKYDDTIITKNKGEFYAMTVKEAEEAGFRRAFKWFGQ